MMSNNKKKPKSGSIVSVTVSSVFIITLLIFFIYVFYISSSSSSSSSSSPRIQIPLPKLPKCPSHGGGDKFLMYAPHSGFSNQLAELKNALLMAAILNRTLVVPPVLHHHAVALGSCPKFRVLTPNQIRLRVWDHILHLIAHGRYISMADIIDLSSLSTVVPTIDFTNFVSFWCGIDLDSICLHDSDTQILNHLKQCGLFLSGGSNTSNNADKCIHTVDVDCRTTVWTYKQTDPDDGTLDSYQADEQLRIKKNISSVRRRHDVLKHLGLGSEAHSSTLLAFGSLFTAAYKGSQSYIDIHDSPTDDRIQSFLDMINFLPFVPEIRNAGKEFAQNKIGKSFLCAQLRLLDGQFKNHREATFSALKQKVESVKQEGPLPVHIFVMTDLPKSNWSNTYLGDLVTDTSSFKVHVLDNGDEIVKQTAGKIAASHRKRLSNCAYKTPDLLLYIEETICSCASLGFVGTAGSTIAESIELMRKNSFC